jgi:hypothetical protein
MSAAAGMLTTRDVIYVQERQKWRELQVKWDSINNSIETQAIAEAVAKQKLRQIELFA